MQVEIIQQDINTYNAVESFESFESRINKSLAINEENEIETIDVQFLVKDNRMYAIIKTK